MIVFLLGILAAASASPAPDAKDTYKDQYCTDPRTLRNHAAYTEWADAYSCTRHRCQPGGRNLAIYTVGCKRVEAPESAIECEEVVEDTNMQFPFCCTRLRCLVVVRGEVWTRVLGQPWEVLPAAPWSHMYKIKKPPPADSSFLPKTEEQGPIYELSEPESEAKETLRSGKKLNTDKKDCNNEVVARANPTPDIVIALSTDNDVNKEPSYKIYENTKRSEPRPEKSRHKRVRKTTTTSTPSTTTSTTQQYFEDDREKDRDQHLEPEVQEFDELPNSTEKPPEASEESVFVNPYTITDKPARKNSNHVPSWTEISHDQWTEHDGLEVENRANDHSYRQPEFQAQEAPEVKQTTPKNVTKEEKPGNLQALVDAIGNRMRDIEHVVQRMSDKVHHESPKAVEEASNEKRPADEQQGSNKQDKLDTKRPSAEDQNYKRFALRNRVSKYLHSKTDSTTEQPLIIEDTNLNGYFSDASNSVLRRSQPKEPALTYMAPVETRRKAPVHIKVVSDNSEDVEKKRKKHSHKKRRNKGTHTRNKKHRSKNDKRKSFNKLNLSGELEKNTVSLEDSSALVN